MPFSYHPPTGRPCPVCEALHQHDTVAPVIDSQNGKASAANNFACHNWYNFVLGYSPQFPDYMLQREKVKPTDVVADPFMGTGTTLVVCKYKGIASQGVDANDFMVDAARTKLNWDVDLRALAGYRDSLLQAIEGRFSHYRWQENGHVQMSIFSNPDDAPADYQEIVRRRPKLLLSKYISDKPFARATLIADLIEATLRDDPLREFFELALTAIIVPISNIRYGPGFGVGKIRDDVDVLGLYASKLNRMIADLEGLTRQQRQTPAQVWLGEARRLTHYLEPDSVALMITSPPYPGDHEYTKHTKLELLFRGYAADLKGFQTIKRRMIRASTTNIYRDDNARVHVAPVAAIQAITAQIQQRLEQDGATSGFEKLYTRLVWEYFGGMRQALAECLTVLRPGGKIALLVSDSHAFKMVHIETARILAAIGRRLGYINPEIILWQHKTSTSHQYYLRENIPLLQKP